MSTTNTNTETTTIEQVDVNLDELLGTPGAENVMLPEEERVIIGPAMIPDLPIYRRDETGEYYAFFDKGIRAHDQDRVFALRSDRGRAARAWSRCQPVRQDLQFVKCGSNLNPHVGQ